MNQLQPTITNTNTTTSKRWQQTTNRRKRYEQLRRKFKASTSSDNRNHRNIGDKHSEQFIIPHPPPLPRKQSPSMDTELVQNKLQEWNIHGHRIGNGKKVKKDCQQSNNNQQQQQQQQIMVKQHQQPQHQLQQQPQQQQQLLLKYDPEDSTTFFTKLFKYQIWNDNGRKLLLNRMQISGPIDFDEALSKFDNKQSMEHVGSGSYADVFRMKSEDSDNCSMIILKVIRLFPKILLDNLETSNVSRITPYCEAYNEFQILSILSKLNTRVEHQRTVYSCQMFPHLIQGFLVLGSLPPYFRIKPELIDGDESSNGEEDSENDNGSGDSEFSHDDDEEDDEDEDEDGVKKEFNDGDDHSSTMESTPTSLFSSMTSGDESNNFQPHQDIFERYQLTAIPIENLMILMEDCGEPIGDCLENLKPLACLSVVKQIITGLMIAECVFQFEHRDLHSGNVLLRPYSQKYINYIIRGRKVSIPAHGYLVKIIDTTFSRIRIDHKIYFKDLSYLFDDEESTEFLSEQEMRDRQMRRQDIAYQQMSQLVLSNWNHFYPKTNLFWIKYLIYKVRNAPCFESVEPEQETDDGNNVYDDCAGIQDNRYKKPQRFASKYRPKIFNRIKSKNNVQQQAKQVVQILKRFEQLAERCHSCKDLFQKIVDDSRLNECCKIAF